MPIKLILVDDHPIILHGLQRLFEREPDFEVVRCCSGGDEALDAVRQQPPDVLVLDLKMSDRHGLDVLRRVAAEAPDWLAPGGCLLVETSRRQAPLALDTFRCSGLTARTAVSEERHAHVVIGSRA